MIVGQDHAGIKSGGSEAVEEYVLERIVNRIFLLPDEIRKQCGGAISSDSSPCAGHISDFRNKDDVDREQNQAAYSREKGAPECLVGEFIPE